MSQRARLGVVAALVVFVLLVGILSAGSESRVGRTVPVVVSMLALVVSLLGTFRSELFPFEYEIKWGTKVFPPMAGDLRIVLPMIFLGTGFADGVVHAVGLLVRGEDGMVRQYQAIGELGEIGTMNGPLHQSHLERSFDGFALPTKQAVVKRLLFVQAQRPKYPFVPLTPGVYEVELFVRDSLSQKPASRGRRTMTVTSETLSPRSNWIIVTDPSGELEL